MLCYTRSVRRVQFFVRLDASICLPLISKQTPTQPCWLNTRAVVVECYNPDSRGKEVADQLLAHFHLAANNTNRKWNGGVYKQQRVRFFTTNPLFSQALPFCTSINKTTFTHFKGWSGENNRVPSESQSSLTRCTSSPRARHNAHRMVVKRVIGDHDRPLQLLLLLYHCCQ